MESSCFPKKEPGLKKTSQYIACAWLWVRVLSVSVHERKNRTRSDRNAAKKRASEKRRFLSPVLTRFSALFLLRSAFPTNMEPRTGCTIQINAFIHVTLALRHLTQVDSAKKKSSESESICPFLRSKGEVL